MSFTNRSSSASGGNGLNDILKTPRMRTELALLVALASDAMRRELVSTFEVPVIESRNSTYKPSAADDLISLHTEPQRAAPNIRDEELQELKSRHLADVSSAKTQGLKRASLMFFDKWQINVLRRLGEVLSVRPDAIKKARARAKAQAEASRREGNERDIHRWAEREDTTTSLDASENLGRWCISLDGFDLSILKLQNPEKIIVVNSVLLLLLSLEHYTAHSRILMLHLTHTLQLPSSTLIDNESKIAQGLLASAAKQMTADESTKKKAAEGATDRRWKVGLATVAGAALIGVTGGLAAPLVAAGFGTILGGLGLGAVATLLGPLATNMLLVGGLFGAYGGRMTGRIMDKYAQEVKDFAFEPTVYESGFTSLEDDPTQLNDSAEQARHKLRVAIGISGAVIEKEDVVIPWRIFEASKLEPFALRYEVEALMKLGKSMSEIIQGYAWDFAKYQLVTFLFAGLWPLGLMRMAKIVDQPFAIARVRSDKAGKVLADALINKVQGERPVTLVGFSLGARVIQSCLLELADQNAFGLIESVVLMGAPIPSDFHEWRRMRALVSGRFANVYSQDDYMLGFLYRASSAQMGVAGLQPIEGIHGVESFDVTTIVKGHTRYRQAVGSILQRIGFEDLDMSAVQNQQQALQQEDPVSRTLTSAKCKSDDSDKFAKEGEGGQIILIDDEGRETSREQMSSQRTRSQQLASSINGPATAGVDNRPEEPETNEQDVRQQFEAIQMEDEEDDSASSIAEMNTVVPEPETSDEDQDTGASGFQDYNDLRQ